MVRIMNFKGTLLNSKSEWNAPPIVRIIAEDETKSRSKLPLIASEIIESVQATPLNTEGLTRAQRGRKLTK